MLMKFIVLLNSVLVFTESDKIIDEKVAREFNEFADQQKTLHLHETELASFMFNANITDENQQAVLIAEEQARLFNKELAFNVTKFDYNQFKNESLRRQFQKYSILGISALNQEDFKTFSEVKSKMTQIYGSATVCVGGKCGLELEPDLTYILSNSKDYDQLEEVWTAWRDSAGKPIRHLYKEYVDLGKKAAQLNGFKSMEEIWLEPWESNDLKQIIRDLWEELRPVYQILHTYVRMKLKQKYNNRMPSDGTIPAHLLGNMWAQDWSTIVDVVTPFPDKKTLDISSTMKEQKYTAMKMFKMAEKFFIDLGLYPMTEQFWNNSMIVKPKDRKVVCHASANDMSDKKDFRIKMCTEINMVDLLTIHHEMGHVEYYMLYRDQPAVFRQGANPGFHEAVGDTISLSVSTPGHLHKVGLYSELEEDYEMTINYQMLKALQKIVFMPFAYLTDLWRWDVFPGKVPYDEWNKRWWQLRLEYQGISPPNKRKETDFDPGAKFHIAGDVEYIRYFVSTIIQFQFHKALCSIAQPNVPIYKCDINNNKAVGERLASGLKLGASKPWPDVMEVLTGSRHMSAQPIIEYFDPLLKYLKKQIKNEKIGWNSNVNQYFEN